VSAAGPATFQLEFPYRRSVGPIIGAFLTGLREQRVLGIKTPSGRVICPPLEYDPDTGAALDDIVELEPVGTVEEWAWVSQPLRKHPLDHPFAWALVRIDGADTTMLHALDAGSMDDIRRGLRVRVRWSEERRGHLTDIACFEPAE